MLVERLEYTYATEYQLDTVNGVGYHFPTTKPSIADIPDSFAQLLLSKPKYFREYTAAPPEECKIGEATDDQLIAELANRGYVGIRKNSKGVPKHRKDK